MPPIPRELRISPANHVLACFSGYLVETDLGIADHDHMPKQIRAEIRTEVD